MLRVYCDYHDYPDNKIHGANMGPIWGRQGPGGPDVGPMNFAIWVYYDGMTGGDKTSVAKLYACYLDTFRGSYQWLSTILQ